jgi:hypothetical protein
MKLKYTHYLFLGAALLAGCPALEEDPEVKDESGVPNSTGTVFVDAFESNNDANSATPIIIGVPVKARIQAHNDRDFYSFSVPDSFEQGGFVIAHLAPFPGQPELQFYNELKQAIGPETNNPTNGADLNAWITVVPGKTHYVRVAEWLDGENAKPYTLQLEFVPVFDSLEPNDKWNEAVAIALDSTYRAFLFHTGSSVKADYNDFYKVSLADSGRIQVALTDFPTDLDPEFSILNATGNSLETFYSGTDGASLIEVSKVVKPGEYIIRVNYWVSNSYLGGKGSELPEYGTKPYHIKVSALPKTGT